MLSRRKPRPLWSGDSGACGVTSFLEASSSLWSFAGRLWRRSWHGGGGGGHRLCRPAFASCRHHQFRCSDHYNLADALPSCWLRFSSGGYSGHALWADALPPILYLCGCFAAMVFGSRLPSWSCLPGGCFATLPRLGGYFAAVVLLQLWRMLCRRGS